MALNLLPAKAEYEKTAVGTEKIFSLQNCRDK
jgi:hypothetical protein